MVSFVFLRDERETERDERNQTREKRERERCRKLYMGRKFILVVALQAGAAKFLTPPAQVERRRRMRQCVRVCSARSTLVCLDRTDIRFYVRL